MGWSFSWRSKKDTIADRIKSYTNKAAHECAAHCYRGNSYRGVLWSVWVISDPATKEVLDSFIGCDILEYRGGEWGIKSLCESSGPYYFSCPLKYLDMVPVPDSKYAPEWREKVRAYHAEHNKKLTKGATYKAAPGLTLGGGKITQIRADSLRPIRGTVTLESGLTLGDIKFKKRMVQEEASV